MLRMGFKSFRLPLLSSEVPPVQNVNLVIQLESNSVNNRNRSMSTSVVIGGGISGLSSAYYLQKSSKYAKIILLESSKRLGGWVKTDRADSGACFELGPRSIRPVGPPGHNTVVLAEELGLTEDILIVSRKSPAAKNRYIYADGKLHGLPTSFWSLFKKLSPFKQPLIMSFKNDFMQPPCKKIDESVYDFFSRRFNEDFAEYAIDPMCRGIYAGDCRDLSVKSCFPLLFEVEQKHGKLIAGILKKSREPKPKLKPCALHKRIVTERASTFSFRHGLQQFTESLESACNASNCVEIHTETACSGIEFEGDKCIIRVNGESIQADHVVSSIFSQDLAKLLPERLGSLSSELSRIPAVSTVVVGIELEGEVQMPVQGFGHLLPSSVDRKVLGVIYDSCTFPTHDSPTRKGTSISKNEHTDLTAPVEAVKSRFTVMMGGSWFGDLERAVPSLDPGELGQLALQSLFRHLNISATPIRVHTEILRDCIPQYRVGHSQLLENIFREIQERRLPLSLVGASYEGVSLNDCINNTRIQMERLTGMDLQ